MIHLFHHVPFFFAVMGWDDLLMLVAKAAVGAAVSKAAQGPKTEMTIPGQNPSEGSGGMDLNSLVQQPQQALAQEQLPKLQLGSRLPPPKSIY